jgi:hypothetical protein
MLLQLDVVAAVFAQVAVVGHEPAERRRVMLVEQQLHALLLATGIGRPHLRLELPGFRREFSRLNLQACIQLRLLLLAEFALSLELL